MENQFLNSAALAALIASLGSATAYETINKTDGTEGTNNKQNIEHQTKVINSSVSLGNSCADMAVLSDEKVK